MRRRKRSDRRRRRRMAERLGIDRAQVRGALPGMAKMSDTLLEFADPLLDLLPADPAIEQLENALALGTLVWNCFVLEASGKDEDRQQAGDIRAHVLATATRSGVAYEVMEDLVNELADRKATLFPDDRRLIAGVDVRRAGDSFHIQAMSVIA